MTDPSFILLYVTDAEASAKFYARLLAKPPVEASPSFAMFALENGVMLGLWGKDGVAPEANPVGGSELGFVVADDATVTARHAEWASKGLQVLQAPTRMDFGFTFTAADPDGHRLRVFCPGG